LRRGLPHLFLSYRSFFSMRSSLPHFGTAVICFLLKRTWMLSFLLQFFLTFVNRPRTGRLFLSVSFFNPLSFFAASGFTPLTPWKPGHRRTKRFFGPSFLFFVVSRDWSPPLTLSPTGPKSLVGALLKGNTYRQPAFPTCDLYFCELLLRQKKKRQTPLMCNEVKVSPTCYS